MRILNISAGYLGGGAERIARELNSAFCRAGHESRLIAGHASNPTPDATILYPDSSGLTRIRRMVAARIEMVTGVQGWIYGEFAKWWKANGDGWDVVVYHNLHGSYFDLSILPQIAERSCCVHVLHDLWLLTGHCAYPLACNRWGLGCGNCPDLRVYPRVLIDRTAYALDRKRRLLYQARPTLVCASDWVDRQVRESVLSFLPRVTIPLGLPDVGYHAGSRTALRERLGWPVDTVVYLYVSSGGLNGNSFKDPATLVDAARVLLRSGRHEGKLIVTVGGKRPLDAELQKLIRQYEHVDKAIDSFYAAADVFVYPTRVETAGLVLIEAARAGIPAITVDAGGCPEIVKDGETGIVVPPCSPELFADAMCNILSANFHAMGEAARRRYSLHHRIDQMASRYLMLFDHMLSESSHCRTMHPCPKIS